MNLILEANARDTSKRGALDLRMLLPACLIIFPSLIFYGVLLSTALDIPFYDNYAGVLGFTNKLTMIHGFGAKLAYLLTAQFNEYKLPFAESLIWLQYGLLGRIDFRVLSAISNAFVALIAFLLWKMFLPGNKDLSRRLVLFAPVSWMLFQFDYQEILNWGGAGLQHIPSLLFAFSTIYFLFRPSRRDFCLSLLCFVLAIASSGNGFLLLPIGIVVLTLERRFGRLAVWGVTGAVCVAGYAYHYNAMSSQASPDGSIVSAILRLRPFYILSFMGSAAAIPFRLASFVLGIALCVLFLYLAKRGYIRRNLTVSCCILFLILTAIGVAGIRSDLGLTQSLSSRYTIFSAFFVIFAYFAVAEEFLQDAVISPSKSKAYGCILAAAIVFNFSMDALQIPIMRQCDRKVVEGMALFEHPTPNGSLGGPQVPIWAGDTKVVQSNPLSRTILRESMRLGVYKPPML